MRCTFRVPSRPSYIHIMLNADFLNSEYLSDCSRIIQYHRSYKIKNLIDINQHKKQSKDKSTDMTCSIQGSAIKC